MSLLSLVFSRLRAGFLVLPIVFTSTAALAGDGDFETKFDADGILNFTIGDGIGCAYTLAATRTEKLLVVGKECDSNVPNGTVLVTRLNMNGSVDLNFGTDGIASIDVGPNMEEIGDIAVLPNQKILVTGSTDIGGGDSSIFLLRLNADGSLDTTFGTNGITLENALLGAREGTASIFVRSDGSILVGGGNSLVGAKNFVYVFTADGSLDTTTRWGAGGRRVLPGTMTAYGLGVDSKGRILVAGGVIDFFGGSQDAEVIRYAADHFLDPTFGTEGDGHVTIPVGPQKDYVMGLEVDSLDRVYLTGFAEINSNGFIVDESFVIRLLPTGELDDSFGIGGIADVTTPVHSSVRARGIQLLPDGRLLVVAESTSGDPDYEVILISLDSDGSIDTSFGLGGYQEVDTVPSSNILFLYDWGGKSAVLPSGRTAFVSQNCQCIVVLEAPVWDLTPDPIEFGVFSGVAPGATSESSVVVSGLGPNVEVPFTVNGLASKNFSPDFSANAGSASNADAITLRHQAADTFETTNFGWIEVGGIQPKNNRQLILGNTVTAVLESTTMSLALGAEYQVDQFLSAITTPTIIDFEGYAAPGASIFLGDPGLFEESGVSISSNSVMFLQNNGFYGTGAFLSPQQTNPEIVDFSLPVNTRAIGFFYSSNAATVTVDGIQTFDLPAVTPGTLGFFGFAREVPIGSLQIVVDGPGMDLDNVFFSDSFKFPVPLLMRRNTDQRWFSYQIAGTEVLDKGKVEMTRSPDYSVVSRDDFNGDGKPDLLLRDTVGGQNGRWVLNTLDGSTVLSEGFIDMTRNSDWVLVATQDINGDGRSDALLRNSTDGRWLAYLINGQNILGQSTMQMSVDLTDTHVGSGDFDSDGRDDVLLRRADGSWIMYLMNGGFVPAVGLPALTGNSDFDIETIADFDGDGDSDILMRRTDGRWFIYLMDGATVESSGSPAFTESTAWSLQAAKDFNGDGRDDVLLRRNDGRWFMYMMDGLAPLGEGPVDMSKNTDFEIVSVEDYSADDKYDVLMRRADGRWAMYLLDGPTILNQAPLDITRSTDWTPYGLNR